MNIEHNGTRVSSEDDVRRLIDERDALASAALTLEDELAMEGEAGDERAGHWRARLRELLLYKRGCAKCGGSGYIQGRYTICDGDSLEEITDAQLMARKPCECQQLNLDAILDAHDAEVQQKVVAETCQAIVAQMCGEEIASAGGAEPTVENVCGWWKLDLERVQRNVLERVRKCLKVPCGLMSPEMVLPDWVDRSIEREFAPAGTEGSVQQ